VFESLANRPGMAPNDCKLLAVADADHPVLARIKARAMRPSRGP
jgi:hypothetical protein